MAKVALTRSAGKSPALAAADAAITALAKCREAASEWRKAPPPVGLGGSPPSVGREAVPAGSGHRPENGTEGRDGADAWSLAPEHVPSSEPPPPPSAISLAAERPPLQLVYVPSTRRTHWLDRPTMRLLCGHTLCFQTVIAQPSEKPSCNTCDQQARG